MANYLQEFEQTLREMLTHNDPEDVVKWVKAEVLKSYKNGMAARKGAGAGSSRGGRSFKRSPSNGARSEISSN